MKKIIKYEFKKFINKRKNKLLIIVFLVLILGINIYNYKQYKNSKDNFVQGYKLISERANAKLTVLNEELLAQSKLDENEKWIEEIERMEGEVEFLNIEAPISGKIANAYATAVEDPEWNRLLVKYLSERYTNTVDSYEKGYIDDIYLSERETNIQEVKYYKYKYDYFMENNIPFQLNQYKPTGANTLNLLF